MAKGIEIVPGVLHYPAYLDRPAQEALRDAIDEVLAAAPPFVPRMPRTGKPFSVRMTNCGPLGWVSDERRLSLSADAIPATGAPWPPMPDAPARALGGACARTRRRPRPASSISTTPSARDGPAPGPRRSELAAPVVSLSLGDAALFRLGGVDARRRRPARSACLRRRDDLRRPGAARLSRRRPHLSGHLDAAAGRRPDQSDAAAGERPAESRYGRPLFGPPLETPTSAGRSTRSPIFQPLCTPAVTVPAGTLSSGASNIA